MEGKKLLDDKGSQKKLFQRPKNTGLGYSVKLIKGDEFYWEALSFWIKSPKV